MTHQKRSKSKKQKSKKLNKGLNPSKFEICVPKASTLFSSEWKEPLLTQPPPTNPVDKTWANPSVWRQYAEGLVPDLQLPGGVPESCLSCDCKPGWILRGEMAIAHACKVHDRIYRQALAFEQVSAIDVGFAIWERRKSFGDFLSIRIHVNQKLPPEVLFRRGLVIFNDPRHSIEPGRIPVKRLRRGLLPFDDPSDDGMEVTETLDPQVCCCKQSKRYLRLQELMDEEQAFFEASGSGRERSRFPLRGVSEDDLSIFCPNSAPDDFTLEDIRLCICGVPIDIINAQYNRTSIRHPGGDAERGTFVDPPLGNQELSSREQLLIARGRVNPLVGGISVGTVTAQAGTLSTIVWDRTDGTPCVLSNWHVLAGAPQATVGQPVYQPGQFDGGSDEDVVAYLKRWHLDEDGDAAIAELCGNREYASGEVLGLFRPISGYLEPKLNMEVRKCGRTTAFTQGFVDGIHLATNIDYGGGVVRSFKNQFHLAPLRLGEDVSQTGDSGSLVVTSFRPAELHDDLETIRGWLQRSSGLPLQPDLCETIISQLGHHLGSPTPTLKPKCRKAIDKILRATKKEVEDACLKIETASLYDSICSYLRKQSANLNAKYNEFCKEVTKLTKEIDNLNAIAKQERKLRRLAGQIGRPQLVKNKLSELKDLFAELNEIPGRTEPDKKPDSESPQENEGYEVGAKSFRISVRACIYDAEKELDEVKSCIKLCQDIEKDFKMWQEHCRVFDFGKKFLDLVRLTPENDFKDRSMHKIIKDLEDKLLGSEANQPGGSVARGSSGEGIKAFLENLVGKSPEDYRWFGELLKKTLNEDSDLLNALIEQTSSYQHDKDDHKNRHKTRAYYAVGMLFAGDTPGSPFGEFAVASPISRLAEELNFSLRPVFEPRSSFRELRVRPPRRGRGSESMGGRRRLAPGDQNADPRGGGPQPEVEPFQSDSGSGSGSG